MAFVTCRRKTKKAVEPMISVVTVDTEQLSFPYEDEYPYAVKVNIYGLDIIKSKQPMYMQLFPEYNQGKIVVSEDTIPDFAKKIISIDTSELGEGNFYMKNGGNAMTNYRYCNYPIQEIRNKDNKWYIVKDGTSGQ